MLPRDRWPLWDTGSDATIERKKFGLGVRVMSASARIYDALDPLRTVNPGTDLLLWPLSDRRQAFIEMGCGFQLPDLSEQLVLR